MAGPDIGSESLDVRITNTDNRHRSQVKASKLPHLMGNKQAKGAQNQRTSHQQQKVGGQAVGDYQASEDGGIIFMESDHVPVFIPPEASGGAQNNELSRESPNIGVQDQEIEGTGGFAQTQIEQQ